MACDLSNYRLDYCCRITFLASDPNDTIFVVIQSVRRENRRKSSLIIKTASNRVVRIRLAVCAQHCCFRTQACVEWGANMRILQVSHKAVFQTFILVVILLFFHISVFAFRSTKMTKPKNRNKAIKNVKCDYCNLMFTDKGKMKKHVHRSHMNSENHYCPECTGSFCLAYLKDFWFLEVKDNLHDFMYHMVSINS